MRLARHHCECTDDSRLQWHADTEWDCDSKLSWRSVTVPLVYGWAPGDITLAWNGWPLVNSNKRWVDDYIWRVRYYCATRPMFHDCNSSRFLLRAMCLWPLHTCTWLFEYFFSAEPNILLVDYKLLVYLHASFKNGILAYHSYFGAVS